MNKTKTLLIAVALATAASLGFAQADTAAPTDAAPKAPSTANKPAASTAHPAHAKTHAQTTHHPSKAKHASKSAETATPAK